MDPASILSLISTLFAQLTQAQAEITELRKALEAPSNTED